MEAKKALEGGCCLAKTFIAAILLFMMNYDAAKNHIIKRLEEGLPQILSYHGFSHTLDVLDAVERLAEGEGIDEENRTLLKTAALFHDAGFLVQYKNNEPIACIIAEETLPDFGYTKEQIQAISEIIKATAMPQNPQNHLEEIICDADLDSLGRDDFFEIAEKLRTELSEQDIVFNKKEWLEFEMNFMKGHEYFTETARNLREAKKQENIKKLLEAAKTEGNGR
jgi:predicted metal-dependent HD superfamily phosphohydrolase